MSGLFCLTEQTLMVNQVQPIFLNHENGEFGLPTPSNESNSTYEIFFSNRMQ